MAKRILITGATDGIGYETAKKLAGLGHALLVHGRSSDKLARTKEELLAVPGAGPIETYQADLSDLSAVKEMATAIAEDHPSLDVIINNAGVYKLPDPITKSGQDARFVVNTVAPYLLTKLLMPLLSPNSRVVNLSSAAQSAVDLSALAGRRTLSDGQAYGQSKLAILMWSFALADQMGAGGPVFIAVNPGSFLGTKMVKDAYGMQGNDISVGADVLARAALSEEFAGASGKYFDNDSHRFASPHPDGMDAEKNAAVVAAIEALII